MLEDKLNSFLEELENRKIEIHGETAFICNDGAVLFAPNERGAVDIFIVRNPVKIDYDLGITEADVKLWKTGDELIQGMLTEAEE